MLTNKRRDLWKLPKRRFTFHFTPVIFFVSCALALTTVPAWAVCGYSGTKNQEGSLKHDGANLYRCDSGNNWENLGALSAADNLGNHTATQNLILGSYYLSGDGGNEGIFVGSSGNVGIGTTNPQALLDVTANSASEKGIFIYNSNSSGYAALRIGSSDRGTNGDALFYNSPTATGLRSPTSHALTFEPAGTERMRIDTSGNVGIGTASPNYKLHIAGACGSSDCRNFYVNFPGGGGLAGTELSGLTYPSSDGYSIWAALYAKAGTGGALAALFNGTSSFMNGNVGIGTTAPAAKLHATDNTSVTSNQGLTKGAIHIEQYTANNDFARLTFGTSAVKAAIGEKTTGSGSYLFFGTSNNYGSGVTNDAMVIDYNGNVGIGTTSPGWSLDVNGSVQLGSSTQGGVRITSTDTDSANIRPSIGNGDLSITDDSGLGTRGITVANGGNVGIATTNPTYKLQLSTDSAAKPGTSTWTIASDERLKDMGAPFTRGLDAINGLNTFYFNYKKNNPLDLPFDKEYVGIKAQDAQRVIPEAVSSDDEGYLHITNDSIIWTAVNAIKELYSKFLSHDREIASLATQKADKAVVDAKVQWLEVENRAKDQKIRELEQRDAEMKARLDKIERILRFK